MKDSLIIGIDLSFNSTGITLCHLRNNHGEKLKMFRVVYDDGNRKSGEILKVHQITNLNSVVYRLPSNVKTDEFLCGNDGNDREQLDITIQSMICCKKIMSIIATNIAHYNPKKLVICIENYIMPSFSGPAQLKNVSGLIMLQSFVRQELIKISIGLKEKDENFAMSMLLPTASHIKLFFTGQGNAEKDDMMDSFVDNWDGLRLLPHIEKGKLDDIIDSFALMCYGYYMSSGIKWGWFETINENRIKSKLLRKEKTKLKRKETLNANKAGLQSIVKTSKINKKCPRPQLSLEFPEDEVNDFSMNKILSLD